MTQHPSDAAGARGSSAARAGTPSGAPTAHAGSVSNGARPSDAGHPSSSPPSGSGARGRSPRSPRSGALLDILRNFPNSPALPPICERAQPWRLAVASELEKIVRKLPHGKTRKGFLRRAEAIRQCAGVVRALRCNDCGAYQAGSGELAVANSGYPCNARTCPLCARKAAGRRRDELRGRIAAVKLRPDDRWRHITLTTVYRPGDPSEVTCDSLRARVIGLARAFGVAWRAGLGQRGTGAYWRIELGEMGAVHMHVLYVGPFVPKAWLEETLHQAYDRCGFAWIREVPNADAAIGEIVKYTTKTASPLSESWITRGRVVMHPTLVARWEVATVSLRLDGLRGILRTVEPVDVAADADGDKSLPIKCEQCGSTSLETVTVNVLEFVRHMHARGARALRGSRASPPAPSTGPPPAVVAPSPAPWSPIDSFVATPAPPSREPEWVEEWVA